MEAVLEVNKKNPNKKHIKRLELEYVDMNYIIINLEEKVIDINGEIYRYTSDKEEDEKIENLIWKYSDLDEYDYWPDKSGDHPPIPIMWRLSFYDELETYYHKSGALAYPPKFMELVNILKKLKKQ